jgi:hypothetical protein
MNARTGARESLEVNRMAGFIRNNEPDPLPQRYGGAA